MISYTRAGISSSLRLVRSFAANVKLSRGVIVSIRTSSCCTNAPTLPKSLLSISLLLNLTVPSRSYPGLRHILYARTLRREVFPEPLAPIIAIISEGLAYPFDCVRIYFILRLSLPTVLMLSRLCSFTCLVKELFLCLIWAFSMALSSLVIGTQKFRLCHVTSTLSFLFTN